LPGDFGEADFPGTQFDEMLNGLRIFRYCLSSFFRTAFVTSPMGL